MRRLIFPWQPSFFRFYVGFFFCFNMMITHEFKVIMRNKEEILPIFHFKALWFFFLFYTLLK